MRCLIFAVSSLFASISLGATMNFAEREKIAVSGDRNYVFVNAHRGAADPAKRIPENSLSAIRHAIELGCDIIEVDPKTTKDGRVILSHDNNKLDRTMKFPAGLDGQTAVADIPYDGKDGDVCFKNARLRVERNSSDVTEERPCTWEELLDACKGHCYIQVDCTHYNCMPDWKKVWEPVVARGMERQVCFKVGQRDGTGIMPPGTSEPETMRGYFWTSIKWKASEPVPEQAFRDRLSEDSSSNRLQAQTIGRYGHDQSGEYGDRTSLDYDVRLGWDKFLDFGATVFMTDYPEELIRHLEKRRRRVAKPNDTRRRVLPPFVANQDYTGEVVDSLISGQETASPEVASPEVTSPEVASPEVASPEAASPEVASPEAASPEVASPEIASPYIILSSSSGAAPGVYEVVVRLKDQKATRWADGTDGEKRVYWRLRDRPRMYKEDADFLTYLAAHPKRVENSPFAKGGDIVLKFMEAREETFVHIYTNTTVEGTFEPAQQLNGRLLVVGGGGGAGASSKKGPWTFFCAGGGAGGEALDKSDVKLDKNLKITVGIGGEGADKGDGAAGGESTVAAANGLFAAAKGGAGGKAGVLSDKNTYGMGGDGAAAKGVLGLNAKGIHPCGGRGLTSDILGEKLEFGGGGAAASHGNNCTGFFGLAGGAGGGGASVSAGYDDKKYYSEPGRDGLGGGGAGGHLKGTKASLKGECGGSGLVIIGYTVK